LIREFFIVLIMFTLLILSIVRLAVLSLNLILTCDMGVFSSYSVLTTSVGNQIWRLRITRVWVS